MNALPRANTEFGAVTLMGFTTGVLEIARFWCARHDIPFLGEADIGHDSANRIVPFGLASRKTGT